MPNNLTCGPERRAGQLLLLLLLTEYRKYTKVVHAHNAMEMRCCKAGVLTANSNSQEKEGHHLRNCKIPR